MPTQKNGRDLTPAEPSEQSHAQPTPTDEEPEPFARPVPSQDYPPISCYDEIVGYIEQVKREWEATADSLPQIVCLLDQRGHIIRANRAVERWGLGSVTEVRGRDLHRLLHHNCKDEECYLKAFWNHASEALRKGEQASCQAEDRHLQRHLNLQVHSQPASMMADGRTTARSAVVVVDDVSELMASERALKALTDTLVFEIETRTSQLEHSYVRLRNEVSERRRVEAALEESQQEYRQLVETMNEGLAAIDDKGAITYLNKRTAEMLGYERHELVGRPAIDLVEHSCREKFKSNIARRESGQTGSYELTLHARDGRRVWVLISPSLLYDHAGQRIGSFAVITDVTERVLMEQALKASEHELRVLSSQVLTAQESERQRIASELHDGLGQALSAIKFSLENSLILLRKSTPDCDLSQMEALIPRMQRAIEEVRRISMDLRPSMLDDLGLLATLRWFCREFQQDYSGIAVDLQLEAEEADIGKALKLITFRIVQEALNNVAKHAGTDTVVIRLSRAGDKIELDIVDHGVGFDPGEIATKRSRRTGGAGLLSMRERAEYSGGTFRVTSNKGSGTRIHITWPINHER